MKQEVMQDRCRITARVPLETQERLKEAADMVGATLNQFIVQSALEKAREIIEREKVIPLSARDTAMFLKLLDSPASAPNEALTTAFERYKQKVADGEIISTIRQAPRCKEL